MNKKLNIVHFTACVLCLFVMARLLFYAYSAYSEAQVKKSYEKTIALSDKKRVVIEEALDFYEQALSRGDIDSTVYYDLKIYFENEINLIQALKK